MNSDEIKNARILANSMSTLYMLVGNLALGLGRRRAVWLEVGRASVGEFVPPRANSLESLKMMVHPAGLEPAAF